jgi:predicted nucleotidyltransferase component of viral defense system
MNVFDQMTARYEIKSETDRRNAIQEVMQQIALAGLYRGGFFEKDAFYGGTCLRIFHSLQRISEDMDFSLVAKTDTFNLEDYFAAIVAEFKAMGRDVIINRKIKAFHVILICILKDDTEM